MGNKAALVERLYLHLQDPSSEPEPEDLIHYLDDFLLAGPPGQPTCSESTETMLRVCERLGIPVALDKLEGPATTITFLGITINTTLQQLRLPPDKLQEMTLLIKSWLRKHKTTKRDLRSLIGKREDIIWCNRFLPSQNGHPPPKTTPRHSTNSGTIRDGPEYEPPAAGYPGVHISRVIPKTFVAYLHTVYLFSQLFCSMKAVSCQAERTSYQYWEQMATGKESSEHQPRHRMFHASSPPQAKTSTDYKRDARADAFTT
eukprot:Em0053g8a